MLARMGTDWRTIQYIVELLQLIIVAEVEHLPQVAVNVGPERGTRRHQLSPVDNMTSLSCGALLTDSSVLLDDAHRLSGSQAS